MSIITENIPKQGFEIVGEQLGAIIALELNNQVLLKGLNDRLETFYERTSSYDKAEGVMINVMFDGTNFDNSNQASVHAPSIFHVDVYASSPTIRNQRGDGIAAAKIKQYMGMLRYIIGSTKYNTLALPQGTIGGTYVESIQMYDVDNAQDAKNVRMARMSVRIRIYECQPLWEAITLVGNDSQVKLDETEKGFKYIFNNL